MVPCQATMHTCSMQATAPAGCAGGLLSSPPLLRRHGRGWRGRLLRGVWLFCCILRSRRIRCACCLQGVHGHRRLQGVGAGAAARPGGRRRAGCVRVRLVLLLMLLMLSGWV
jgi:hypothetical protein